MNPTHGSVWIVQILSKKLRLNSQRATRARPEFRLFVETIGTIHPLGVRGLFRSYKILSKMHPPKSLRAARAVLEIHFYIERI